MFYKHAFLVSGVLHLVFRSTGFGLHAPVNCLPNCAILVFYSDQVSPALSDLWKN